MICKSVNAFLMRLSYEKYAAINTVSSYKHDLVEFAEYLGRDIADAGEQEIQTYLQYISEGNGKHPLCARSIARKISAFRTFFADLIRLGMRKDNPMSSIFSPKLLKSIPSVISEEQLEELFNQFAVQEFGNLDEQFRKMRDLLIFEILYSCGVRVSELCNLQVNHIFLEDEFLVVLGKGGKERLLPIGKRLITLISEYLTIRCQYLQTKSKDCEYLITSKFGKAVSRMFVWKLLRKYSENIDINNLSPHKLRHAFATHMLWNGADLRVIQELLGHSDISTTEIYTHLDKSHLETVLEKYHPLAENNINNVV
ncbi:MAG: tyrosine recombinase [Brevinemataceae bacterium]